jgi:ATP-dependent Lhr-like helicase
VRKKTPDHNWVSISAADPLNLVGVLTPGTRVAAIASNRVLYRDGVPVAVHSAGQSEFIVSMEPEKEWEARQALVRRNLQPGDVRAGAARGERPAH